MTLTHQHGMIARIAIFGMIAAVLWVVLVRPLRRELAQAEADLRADQQRIADAGATPFDPFEGDRLRRDGQAIDAVVAQSAQTGRLYDAFRDAAQRTGVRVERVDPAKGTSNFDKVSRAANVKTTAHSYSTEVVGPYDAVARFLGGLGRELGMARITALRLSPGGVGPAGSSLVRASVDVQHYVVAQSGDPAADQPATGGTP